MVSSTNKKFKAVSRHAYTYRSRQKFEALRACLVMAAPGTHLGILYKALKIHFGALNAWSVMQNLRHQEKI